ncbi:MAG: WG repeat-containing protein [Bacteroidia bacterium]|nr:WG repeat-containing protein [Bacteroidia bacterium]
MRLIRFLTLLAVLASFARLTSAQSKLFPVERSGKWGYVDTEGTLVIRPGFDHASEFVAGVAKVSKNGKQQMIDSRGHCITPPNISDFTHVDNRLIFIRDNLYGLADVRGNVLVKPQYTSISSTSNAGTFKMSLEGKTGLMDSMGNVLVNCQYATIQEYNGIYWLVASPDEEQYGFYVPAYQVHLEGAYYDIQVMAKRIFVLNKKGIWDVLDKESHSPTGNSWTSLQSVNDDYFIALNKKDTTLYLSAGTIPVCVNRGVVTQEDGNQLVLRKGDDQFIVMDDSLHKDTFDWVNLDINRGFLVRTKGYVNILDSTLQPTLPWKYQNVFRLKRNLLQVAKSSGLGLYSVDQNKEIVSCRYGSVQVFDKRIKARTHSGSVVLFAHRNGVVSDSMEFKNVRTVVAHTLNVYRNQANYIQTDSSFRRAGRWFTVKQRWGYKSEDGRILIPPTLSSYTRIGESEFTSVTKDIYSRRSGRVIATYRGLVNERTGKLILKPSYTFIDTRDIFSPTVEVLRARRTNGKFELVNKHTGEMLRYDTRFIDEFVNGRARIYLRGVLSYTQPPSDRSLGEARGFARRYGYAVGHYERNLQRARRLYRSKELQVHAVGGRWSYIDERGKLVRGRYQGFNYATQFDPINAVVYLGDSCALMNRQGDFLTSFEYRSIDKIGNRDSSFYMVAKRSSSYNYYTASGAKIGNTYAFGTELNDGAAWVLIDNQFAILRRDGMVVELEEEVNPSRNTFHDGYSPLRIKNQWTVIDSAGNYTTSLDRGIIPWCSEGIYTRRVAVYNGKKKRRLRGYQLFNVDGSQISDELYQRCYPFDMGVASVRSGSRRMDLVNTKGEVLAHNVVDKIYPFSENGYAQFKKSGGLGIVDTAGEIIIKPRFKKIYQGDSTFLALKNNTVWLFDRTGKQLTKIDKVTRFSEFNNGLAMVKHEKKIGYIDEQGRWQIKPTYKYATQFGKGVALVQTPKGYNTINNFGETVTQLNVLGRPRFSEGIILYKGMLGFCYMDKFGHLISDDYYTSAGLFTNGYAKVKKNGKWGLINTNGRYIIPPDYSKVTVNDNGEISAQKDLSYGLINNQGERIVDPTYDAIQYYPTENVYRLVYGIVPSYMNATGNWIWKQESLSGL